MRGELIDRTYTVLADDLEFLVSMVEEGERHCEFDIFDRICRLVTALDSLKRMSVDA